MRLNFLLYNFLMAIYFFYGDEDYLIDEELKSYRSKLDSNFSAMNYTVYDNPSYPDLIAALRTQPMMFGKLMIVINCDKLLSSSLEDSQIKEIESALEGNTENLDIFFVAKYPRNEGKKPDSRKKIYKVISKYNTKEFPTIKTYKTAELINWINKEAKKHSITLDNNAANILIEQIGNNLREFAIELEKLALLAYPEKKITSDMVKKICISNQDLFNFTDYIMKNDKGKALKELQLLLDKKHPLEILAATQTMLRKWILIKLKSSTMPPSEISKLVGQHEFVVKQTIQKLKNTQLKNLVHLKESLTDAEYKIKSGASLDIISEVENAIIR